MSTSEPVDQDLIDAFNAMFEAIEYDAVVYARKDCAGFYIYDSPEAAFNGMIGMLNGGGEAREIDTK